MNETEKYLVFGAIGLVAMLVLYFFITRWVFSMKRQLWNQKQQINLLVKIAQQLGVKEDLSAIEEKNNNSEDHLL